MSIFTASLSNKRSSGVLLSSSGQYINSPLTKTPKDLARLGPGGRGGWSQDACGGGENDERGKSGTKRREEERRTAGEEQRHHETRHWGAGTTDHRTKMIYECWLARRWAINPRYVGLCRHGGSRGRRRRSAGEACQPRRRWMPDGAKRRGLRAALDCRSQYVGRT